MDSPDNPFSAFEISLEEAAELIQSDNPPEILDVREADERSVCRIGESLHIPTGQIPARWDSLPKDKHLIVYCHHGKRSLFVTRFLKEMGIEGAQSMQGGIDAWSRLIDPTVRRY